jgi:hypothetical protein
MKKLVALWLGFGVVFTVSTGRAIDLKQSKVTQVVNEVQIISAGDQSKKIAVVNDIFSMPDILRTGTASRAELVAPDETITRVGANTMFSFDPANRTIDLKQGSLLFHAPHGKGGGTIHTGSATASVLGTTLIVTTTPNGGLKVLDLEGAVEVKFLNGLKQRLNPGQMTFILPGGGQLAPIIIFRLDELTRSSLLVKGFNQPLDSLPLIQNQIEKQQKLIQSGKVTDTGLYAGNDASPNQVAVLDPNTVNLHNQNPLLAAAISSDATISQPSLTDASIPTPPNHVFADPAISSAGGVFLSGEPFAGFLARNIFVNPPVAGLDSLTVDLSPYANLATFDLVAVNNLSLEGAVTFSGLSPLGNLSLIAGNQLLLAPGITVRAEVYNFLLSAPATLTLDGVTLFNFVNNDGGSPENSVNSLDLNSGGDVVFKNGALVNAGSLLTVSAGNDISATDAHLIGSGAMFMAQRNLAFDTTTIDAKNLAIFSAPGAINFNNATINSAAVTVEGTGNAPLTFNNTTINAPSVLAATTVGALNVTGSTIETDAGSGGVSLISSSGSTTITGTTITTHYLTVNSGDGILLDGSGQALTATGSGATANFTAPNLITVNNADFSTFAAVNLAANTLNLSDVNLGSGAVTLKSLMGLLNLGSSRSGYVNFIENVTYKGGLAQNYINNGITVTTLH